MSYSFGLLAISPSGMLTMVLNMPYKPPREACIIPHKQKIKALIEQLYDSYHFDTH
jgi:hypothetical protein